MAGITVTDRSYKGITQREHLRDCPGRKQWNIHRRKEYRVNFIFQIFQSDPDRIKHMSWCIIFISKKDYIIGSKVTFQNICPVSCHYNYFRDSGLPEIVDHALCNGNRSKLKHGFKVSHSRGFPCGNDERTCLHDCHLLEKYCVKLIILYHIKQKNSENFK